MYIENVFLTVVRMLVKSASISNYIHYQGIGLTARYSMLSTASRIFMVGFEEIKEKLLQKNIKLFFIIRRKYNTAIMFLRNAKNVALTLLPEILF